VGEDVGQVRVVRDTLLGQLDEAVSQPQTHLVTAARTGTG